MSKEKAKRIVPFLGLFWILTIPLKAGEDSSLNLYEDADNCLFYTSPEWQKPFYISEDRLEESIYNSLEEPESKELQELFESIQTLKELGLDRHQDLSEAHGFSKISETQLRKMAGPKSSQFFAKFFTLQGLQIMKKEETKLYSQAYSYFIQASHLRIEAALYMISKMQEQELGTQYDRGGSWTIYKRLLNNGFFSKFPMEREEKGLVA